MDEYEILKEKLQDETLEGELTRLRWRKDNDPTFDLQQLKIMIDSMCRFQDEGSRDRGGIQHIEADARLAAAEILYHEWQQERLC